MVRYLTGHGNQFLLMFGIISKCLLLPIEDYAQDQTQQHENNHNRHSENRRYQTLYGSDDIYAHTVESQFSIIITDIGYIK